MPRAERFAPTDFAVWEDAREMARYRRHVDIAPVRLDDAEVDALVAFLHSLTDEGSIEGRLGKPDKVPSRLPID